MCGGICINSAQRPLGSSTPSVIVHVQGTQHRFCKDSIFVIKVESLTFFYNDGWILFLTTFCHSADTEFFWGDTNYFYWYREEVLTKKQTKNLEYNREMRHLRSWGEITGWCVFYTFFFFWEELSLFALFFLLFRTFPSTFSCGNLEERGWRLEVERFIWLV